MSVFIPSLFTVSICHLQSTWLASFHRQVVSYKVKYCIANHIGNLNLQRETKVDIEIIVLMTRRILLTVGSRLI